MGIETEDDATCAFAKRELPEDETKELLPAGKCPDGTITLMGIDALLKGVARKNTRKLAEDIGTGVHAKSGKCGLIVRFPIEMSKNKILSLFLSRKPYFSFFYLLNWPRVRRN